MRPTFRLLVAFLLVSCHAHADEAVAAKMRTVEYVKTTFGDLRAQQIGTLFRRAANDSVVSTEA